MENKLAVQIHFDDGAVQCVSKAPRLKGNKNPEFGQKSVDGTHLEGIILGFPGILRDFQGKIGGEFLHNHE